jgi:uncharacterized coiled-coil protein SlyX
MHTQRLEALEVRYSHLEKLFQDLSEVVWRQQQELDHLRDTVRQFKDRLQAEPGLVDAARSDLPPHY